MSDDSREIQPINIEEELKQSYLDYAMSVIVGGPCLTCVMASSRCTAVFCMRWTSSATIGIVRTKSPLVSSVT